MKFSAKMFLFAAALTLFPVTAQSHEFIIKPVKLHVGTQATVPFSIVSAHLFMVSEEMEPLEQVDVVATLDRSEERRVGKECRL